MTYLDTDLKEIISKGREQGYLTYDEVNQYLPDEDVNPEKLDNLLFALDEKKIKLVEEAPKPEFEEVSPAPSAAQVQAAAEAKEAEAQAATAEQAAKKSAAASETEPRPVIATSINRATNSASLPARLRHTSVQFPVSPTGGGDAQEIAWGCLALIFEMALKMSSN